LSDIRYLLVFCVLNYVWIGPWAAHKVALTSSFLLVVLVNTGNTLIQAANDEERVMGQRTCGPEGQGLEQA